MIVDLVSQMKTMNLMLSILQGNPERCMPYPFEPYREKPLPDRSLYGLETSTPEAQGVESAWLNGFFTALRDCQSIHVHSVAVMRHGKLIAEASFKPYTAAFPHMQFSAAKSVVGMAVGMAVSENRLSVTDKLVDFFPDERSFFHNSHVSNVTIQNLLQMTAGVKYNELFSVMDRDWVRGYLSSECIFEPGSEFYYNSMNTYMLSAVLHRMTGISLVDYLMPRLFTPMRIPRPRWETCPMGIEKGGWGLYLRSVDMAKLGQLYLQQGLWHTAKGDRQLVPEQWVRDSIEKTVRTDGASRDDRYGYQLWSFPVGHSYQYSGLFGQHVFILPHLDAVVAMTSGSQTFVTDEASTITEKYFAKDAEGFHDEPLPNNLHALRKLEDTLAHLYAVQQTIPPQPKKPIWPPFQPAPQLRRTVPPLALSLEGKSYRLESGYGTIMPQTLKAFINNYPPTIEAFSFRFTPGMCHIGIRSGGEDTVLTAGLENEPFRSEMTVNGETYPVGCSVYLTTDEDDRPVLKLYAAFLQTPFTRVIKFVFYHDLQQLLVRFDEQPSIEESCEMMFGLMSGAGASQKHFAMTAAQEKMRPRLKQLSMPKMHGRLIKPEQEMPQTAEKKEPDKIAQTEE
ncbi:serine hydrolase domain-containing protein [Caproicibacterium lactatifermentans]|jgi:CubicO group peptidase (beta-lactamase class C family)|uniref:serine hydrolase domain-containing protein n=1 Tax=Caproicibacterium lactatifermentans TaxID=2666138 RepID=UPI003D93780B